MAQQIAEMVNTSGGALEFDTFFAQLRQQREPGGIAPAHRLKLERITERQRLFAQNLSDLASFTRYMKAHPLSALIERKIAEEVNESARGRHLSRFCSTKARPTCGS